MSTDNPKQTYVSKIPRNHKMRNRQNSDNQNLTNIIIFEFLMIFYDLAAPHNVRTLPSNSMNLPRNYRLGSRDLWTRVQSHKQPLLTQNATKIDDQKQINFATKMELKKMILITIRLQLQSKYH